jgi:3'(2'), 5'-bisphosphate nucleotidase
LNDHQLAAWLAEEAGKSLLALRSSKRIPADLGGVADREANAFLMEALRLHRPEDAILSEESPDDLRRLEAERVWIVDPLDGTREYVEGRDDWAVHVALCRHGVPVAGAVSEPTRDRTIATDAPPDRRALRDRPIMLVSRSRPPAISEALASHLGAEIHHMGSAGAKALAVICGEADLYFHSGGQHEWDNCAPVAVALAAGLTACRADGRAIVYNQAVPIVPDLMIGTPELVSAAIAFVASAGQR